MPRFSTIVYSVMVPSIVALGIIKLGERHNINLMDITSLTETVKHIFSEQTSSQVTEETNKKSPETAKEFPKQDDKKKTVPQGNIIKTKSLKSEPMQKTPSNKAEPNLKRSAEETKSVEKVIEAKQKGNEIKPQHSGAKPVGILSNEDKKATESPPSVSKTSDKSTSPPQNVVKKPAEEKKPIEKELVFTNQETKKAAEVLTAFTTEFDKSLINYLIGVKTNYEIIKAIQVVEALKNNLPKGGKCSLTKEEDDGLRKFRSDVEKIVENCVNKEKSTDNELRTSVEESLKKVRDLEVNLRQNQEQCPQPPSNICIQNKNRLLKALKDLSSEESLKELTGLSGKSLNKAKLNIDTCTNKESVEIKVSLEKIHLKLNSCETL